MHWLIDMTVISNFEVVYRSLRHGRNYVLREKLYSDSTVPRAPFKTVDGPCFPSMAAAMIAAACR